MADQIIRKGTTHRIVLRWEQPVVRYVPITGVSNAAPVVITATGHDMPDGWRFAVSGVKGGGSTLNAKHAPPKEKDYFKGKVLSANTIEINAVNGAAWPVYSSGGILQFNLPVDLTGVTAVLQVRESTDLSAPVLIELTSAAGGIEIDPEGIVTLIFSPADTVGISVTEAYFDVELTFLDGTLMAYPKTKIIFDPEITRE